MKTTPLPITESESAMIKWLVKRLAISREDVIHIGLKANEQQFGDPEVHEFLDAKRVYALTHP